MRIWLLLQPAQFRRKLRIGWWLLLLALGLHAQTPATRTVLLSWTASVSVGVTGYNVYRCTSPCATTPGPQLTTVTGTVASDLTPAVGQTYIYSVTAVAPACTPTTPLTTPCGESLPATVTVPVPPKPASGGALVVIVQ